VNNQDETGRRDERQSTLERHKGRAKEMVRGTHGSPEPRSAEPASARRPEAERGSRNRQERGASVTPDRSEARPQGRPPAHAAAHGLRRQQGGEEGPPADRRQQVVRGRVDRIKQARRLGAPERREPARDARGRGPQERPGIAERIRMARSQPQQDQRSRA